MGLLKDILTKAIGPVRVGSVSVCDGDIDKGHWTYFSDHRLMTLGTFTDKNLKLKNRLAKLRKIDGNEADRYISSGKAALNADKIMLGALFGGIVGLAAGAAVANKATKGLDSSTLICFEASLRDGKRFVAVTFPEVFKRIEENHNAIAGT